MRGQDIPAHWVHQKTWSLMRRRSVEKKEPIRVPRASLARSMTPLMTLTSFPAGDAAAVGDEVSLGATRRPVAGRRPGVTAFGICRAAAL